VLQVVVVPVFASAVLSGTNLILSGSNGINGAPYHLLTSTNVALPMSNWTRLLTNAYGVGGSFSENIPMDSADCVRFYRLQSAN